MISCILDTLAAAAILTFTATSTHASKEAPVIGFSTDDLRVEHWTHDRDYSVESTKKLGTTVNVQSANANEAKQIAQVESLIAQNVDVFMIMPFNSKALDNAVTSAKKRDTKVVSYGCLILNADIDGCVTFDSVGVSGLQTQNAVRLTPEGNYFLLGSATTDNNARLLREGQMKVLKPYADKGDIKIVGKQRAPEWNPPKAQNIVENALTVNNNNTQGIIASNDGTADGVIQALVYQKLASKVLVSGQDADLAAVKRMAEGTQATTAYKPIRQIAATAVEVAVDLVKSTVPKFNTKLNNGKKDVGTALLTLTLLTKNNLDSAVVKDGFYTHRQIFGG